MYLEKGNDMSNKTWFILNLLCCAAGAGLGNVWVPVLNGVCACWHWTLWRAEEQQKEEEQP